MTKLNMGGVCEKRFEGLVCHQGASIRYERVKTNNSYARTLILGSFSFIVYLSKEFMPLFFFFT
jgi:hypothetical protein